MWLLTIHKKDNCMVKPLLCLFCDIPINLTQTLVNQNMIEMYIVYLFETRLSHLWFDFVLFMISFIIRIMITKRKNNQSYYLSFVCYTGVCTKYLFVSTKQFDCIMKTSISIYISIVIIIIVVIIIVIIIIIIILLLTFQLLFCE